MTLVGEDHVGDGNVTGVHGRDDLVALAQFHPRVIGALADQQRTGDSIDMHEWRDLVKPFGLVGTPDPLLEHHLHRFPVGGNRRKKRSDMGRADDVDPACPEFRITGHARERGVAAIGPAHDREPIGVGPTLVDRPLGRIVDVVLHRLVPLTISRIEEGLAETGRPAEVHAQHRVAPIGKPLVIRVVSPAVTSPWTTVHEENQWHSIALLDAKR